MMITPIQELQGDVLSISHATAAFAAIKRGGRVVTFGVDDLGGPQFSALSLGLCHILTVSCYYLSIATIMDVLICYYLIIAMIMNVLICKFHYQGY